MRGGILYERLDIEANDSSKVKGMVDICLLGSLNVMQLTKFDFDLRKCKILR